MESGGNRLFIIDINEISEEEFLHKKESLDILVGGDMQPRSYFLLKVGKEKQWLIDQVDVGLKNIPYMLCNKSHILFVATTFNLYVINCLNNKIIFESTLETPCVDFYAKDEIVYIICETELIHFSLVHNCILKQDRFSYMVETINKTINKVVITLENGRSIVIR